MKDIAIVLLDIAASGNLSESAPVSDKAIAMFFPHISKLAKRTGMDATTLVPAFQKISEEVDAAFPADSALKRFIRSTVILFAHTKPSQT